MHNFKIQPGEECGCERCGAELAENDYAVETHAGEVYCSHFCAVKQPAPVLRMREAA
jgi:hypothetical protein